MFPDTAVLGDAVPDVDPRSLVLQEVDTFSLGMSADGTVLAVDATPARAIAESRLSGSIDEGYELVDDSTTIDVGDGRVVNGVVTFPVEASAKQVRPVDAAALRSSVLGLPVADARRLLEPYGDVSIQLWPGWVSSVPSLQQRVTLDVAPAAEPVPSAG